MTITTLLWRRLDQPGHDSCRLIRLAAGWRLEGAAVFREARRTCHLSYAVSADAAFRTTSATVSGYVGKTVVRLHVRSAGRGRWLVNGKPNPAIAGCLDIDLGFTPSTNLLAIRRLSLRVGESADAPAAYLAFPRVAVRLLPQHYKRTGRHTYAYQSPTAGYAGTLHVTAAGAVRKYPGLFELIASG
jgi:hypothetical protein